MKKNMGGADRIIRIIVALVFAGLYFFGPLKETTIGLVLVIVGAVFVLTSLISFCPLYLPFGINTCKKK